MSKKKNPNHYLLIGAGEAAREFLIDIQNHFPHIYIAGILDDDKGKHLKKVQGVPILGPIRDISRVIRNYRITVVVICIEKIHKETLDNIIDQIKPGSCVLKIIPSTYENIKKNVTFDSVRNLSAEDLIGRTQIEIDPVSIAKSLNDRCIFISGAGGTIGSAICRQLLKYPIREIVCFSRGEHSLYSLKEQLDQVHHNGIKLSYILGDIRDYNGLLEVMKKKKPDIVFHAAAHKHVPFMEDNEKEAVKNNVFGTDNMLRVSLISGIKKFVFISTDKAVNPENIMGYTKKIGEALIHYYHDSYPMMASVVRFGNVIGSRGSVVPLFTRQLEQGGPITVTHPDVERYFMTIPESANLVIHATAISSEVSGERTFMLDMGKPVLIDELVRRLIKVHGFRIPEDMKIIYTGLRRGEKIVEELYSHQENLVPTSNKKIYFIKKESLKIRKQKYQEVYKLMEKFKKDIDAITPNQVRKWLKVTALKTDLPKKNYQIKHP